MGNDKYALDLLKELSPFKQKYFFLIFVPFMISISVFIPYDDYSGISIKSQTSFLDEKAKILTDTFLFMTIFMSLYIFIKYRFIGVSRELHNRMLKAINFVSFKQKEKETGVYLKNMSWFLCFIYFLLFIKMFFTSASDSPKYYWIYGSGTFTTIIYSLFFYSVFLSFTILIVWAFEIKHYLHRIK